jgi:hypothetical protein
MAVAAVLLYVGGGHSAGTMAADHDGMAGAEVGICLVLVAFLAVVRHRPTRLGDGSASSLGSRRRRPG